MMTTIVNFHGIGDPGRAFDEGEAPFWLTQSQFCRVLDKVVAHKRRGQIMLTFDDGNLSDMAIAAPELVARGLTGVFFVLTGRFEQRGSLARADVVGLRARGMEIGSHGIAHSDLKTLDGAQLRQELVASRRELEALCDVPVVKFAIPFGRYSGKVLGAIADAGYEAAYTSDGGEARTGQFVQPRRSLRGDMEPGEIDAILAGQMKVAARLRRTVSMAIKRRA